MNNQSHNSYITVNKPIGPVCNIHCRYCFYLKKQELYPREKVSDFRMSDAVLEENIKQYMDKPDPQVTFVWQGGEPTMLGLDFFKKVIELQMQYNTQNKQILNTLQTNGILLNDAWARFFKENNFLIGVSLDGPAHHHNKYRQSTFDGVMKGIQVLKKHDVDYNIICTVNNQNANHPLEVYNFFKEHSGTIYWQFIPIVEHTGSTVHDYSVLPQQYGNFLVKMFNHWVRNDIGKISIQIFDVVFNHFMGLPPTLCIFADTCGNAPALEHNGDFFSCDHYVDKEYFLGNIMDKPMQLMVDSNQQRNFGNDKKDTLPEYCLKCSVKSLCNGGCPKNRFLKTPDGEPGLNYLCSAYKQFFTHVTPYMQHLSEQYLIGIPFEKVMKSFRDVPAGKKFD